MRRMVTRQLPLGKVATTQYGRGLVQAELQMHYGYRTTYLYTARAQRTALIDPYGQRTSWVYDAAGELVAQQDAFGNLSTYSYDLAGRQVEVEDTRGYRATTLYDSAGQAAAQVGACGERTSFVYDGAGRQIATQDALGYYHTTNYDGASRVQSTVDPLGFGTTSVYDIAGQSLGSIDALGRRTTAVYDAAGRSIAQQDARGYLTTFVYDGAGQQVALVNANGGRWTTQYDARGMVQVNVDPLAARTTFVYNADGVQTLKQDGRGNRITQNYEPRNLPLYTIYPDNAQVTVNFDQGPRMIGEWDSAGRRLLTYDRLGRLTELRNVTQGWRLTYGYDAVSNRNFLVAPDGRTTYQYDCENRCSEVWNPYNERTTWQYDSLGRELRKTYANGMVASHTYDPAGRETLLTNRLADGTGVAIYTATYDAVGNRLTNLELDGDLVTYSYDASYQLVREQRSGPYAYDTTYQYDGDGNRLLKVDSGSVTTYAYNAADELLLVTPPSGQPTTSTWDADGNLRTENAAGQVTTYSWNPDNRLTSLVNPDATTEAYVYQADGLRQKRTNSDGVTLFLWDQLNLLLETDAQVAVAARYTDYPGYWGGFSGQRRGGVGSYPALDLQDSVRMLVAIAGGVTDVYDYAAFGILIAQTGSTVNPFQFGGSLGYYSASGNRVYARQREARVDLGRWISLDPVAIGSNWFVYGSNNPIGLVDPTGLDPKPGGSSGQCSGKPGYKRGGLGNGQCPGADAVKWVMNKLHNEPDCLKKFLKSCTGGLSKNLGSVPFCQADECAPGQSASTCVRTDPSDPFKCLRANYICFNKSVCDSNAEEKGKRLLWEMVNWCQCAIHHRADLVEASAVDTFADCHIFGDYRGGVIRA